MMMRSGVGVPVGAGTSVVQCKSSRRKIILVYFLVYYSRLQSIIL